MAVTASGIEIDTDKLADNLRILAGIGRTPTGGTSRLAFTPEDMAAREFATAEMVAVGLEVHQDEAGNIIGRLAGSDGERPVVMTGSHLDSVPEGGNFDGTIGVFGAIEAVRAIKARGLTPAAPIEVVVFSSEEAPRFGQGGHHFGSRVMAGLMDLDLLDHLIDENNISLAGALRDVGIDPDQVSKAQRAPGEVAAFIELHMEQGRILRDREVPVGVVTTITGATRYWLTLHGSADHSGATPMKGRRDALTAAAEVVLAVERIGVEMNDSLVSTVGVIRAMPGSISVVPGTVELGIDIRDINGLHLTRAARALRNQIGAIADRRSIVPDLRVLWDDQPISMTPSIRATIAEASEANDLPAADVASHSGHDTASISMLAPSGMIFVRNESGRSHSAAEYVRIEDIAAGSRVLATALLSLANTPLVDEPSGKPTNGRQPRKKARR
jgi:hydantoinase/carbamoylase family amidase